MKDFMKLYVCVCSDLRSLRTFPCLTELFRAAAEAEPHHILKMYTVDGSVVNISPQLEPNSEDSCYRLEVVAADLQSERRHHGNILP